MTDVPDYVRDSLRTEHRWNAFLKKRIREASARNIPVAEATEMTLDLMYPCGRPWETAEAASKPTLRGHPPQPRGAFKGKRVSLRRAVEWVFDAMGEHVEPGDAPSPGAWALLDWAKKTAANKRDFYTTFASKLIPSRSTLEVEERRRDDGEDCTRTIDYLLKLRKKSLGEQ